MKRYIKTYSQVTAMLPLIAQALLKKKELVIEVKEAPKTLEQLGYLHSEVLPKLTVALFDAGEISKSSERHAKYWLKRSINYGDWVSYEGGEVFDPDSFANADKGVLSQAIDTAIHEAQLRGVYIAPPKTKGIA